VNADPVATDEIVRRLRTLAEQLTNASADARRAVIGIGRCWTDDRGRGWVERVGLVLRQLDHDAATCVTVAERLVRQAAAATHDAEVDQVPGVRLGSTAGRRVDNAQGMRIAVLSDEESLGSDGR